MNRLNPDEQARVMERPEDFSGRTVLDVAGQLEDEGRVEVVGAAHAARNLSGYLRRVEAGEVIVISRRGKPIAQMIPAHPRITTEIEDG